MKPLLGPELLSGPRGNVRLSEAADIACFLRIPLEIEPLKSTVVSNGGSDRQLLAWKVLNELLAWMRVLSRQFWVGYREQFSTMVKFEEFEIGETHRKVKGGAGMGLGFEYGRLLDESMWQSIEPKLARSEAPSAPQLFFCDALLDLSEGDVSQAIIALGIACEIEVQNLIDEMLVFRDEMAGNLFRRYAKYQFAEALKMPGQLGGTSFGEADNEAADLVQKLYSLRGKAVHGKKISTDINIGDYIEATEKLFAWVREQRAMLSADAVP